MYHGVLRFSMNFISHSVPNEIKMVEIDKKLAYFLGIMKGDGSAYITNFVDKQGKYYYKVKRYCIQLQAKDRKFVESFQKILGEFGIKRKIVKKKYYPMGDKSRIRYSYFIHYYKRKPYRLWKMCFLSNDEIFEGLKDNSEAIKSFIRGIYESEGGYYRNSRGGDYLMVCCGIDKSLIDLVAKLLQRIGYKYRIKLYDNTHPPLKNKGFIWEIRLMGGKQAFKKFFKEVNPCIKTYLCHSQCCVTQTLENYGLL